MKVNPLAGKPAPPAMLANIPKLMTACFTDMPDFSVPTQRVALADFYLNHLDIIGQCFDNVEHLRVYVLKFVPGTASLLGVVIFTSIDGLSQRIFPHRAALFAIHRLIPSRSAMLAWVMPSLRRCSTFSEILT